MASSSSDLAVSESETVWAQHLRRCRRKLINETDRRQLLNRDPIKVFPNPGAKRGLPKPIRLVETPEHYFKRHSSCRIDICNQNSRSIQQRYPNEIFCPRFRSPAWRGPERLLPRYHQKTVSLVRHIRHFQGLGVIFKRSVTVNPTAFEKIHLNGTGRNLPRGYWLRRPTKWERSLCNKSIAFELRHEERIPNHQCLADVFCPPPSLVRPSPLRRVLTGGLPRIILTNIESGLSSEVDLGAGVIQLEYDFCEGLPDLNIDADRDTPEDDSYSKDTEKAGDLLKAPQKTADSEDVPIIDLDGSAESQRDTSLSLSQKLTRIVTAGPWADLERSLKEFGSSSARLTITSSKPLVQRSSHEPWAQLDQLKDRGQKLFLRSRLIGLDGATDLPSEKHPNLASFSFSFPTATKPTSAEYPRTERYQVVAAEATQDRPKLAASLLPRPGDSTPPNTPNLLSLLRKEFTFSVPTVQVPAAVELDRPSRRLNTCASGVQPSPSTPSPVRDENSKPRSLRRVIRPDDSWQAGKKTPQTAFRVPTEKETPLKTAALEVPKVKEVAFRRSTEFLKAVQPLQTPRRPAAEDLLAQDYSDEDLKPRPLSIRKQKYSFAEEPETPRLTRELVLKHLASDESLGDRNDKVGTELDPENREQFRNVKRARREGVIFERLETASEDEAKFQRKIQEEITAMADLLHPESAAAMTEHRREAVRLAKSQEAAVVEKCKRSNQEMPEYAFDELIGKGSYGRVYKGRQTTTKKVVAIKVIDIDEADFHSVFEEKDEQIKDFNREIRILKQAQDSGAPNMNQMIEALPVHSQLWLVCEYCPGGSVKTLMRATNDRLNEKYILIVARELAKALTGLHEAGIMHRDIKAANVLIHEEGRLQLCDFGVATVLDTKSDKRKTFIGTPHWMPPELFVENPEYSDEVDVWEYGCTLYECALGKPPHSDLRERQQLASRMRRLKQSISLPEHEEFSDGLRNLVAYTLSPDAKTRPSMKDVLAHDWLRDTEESHPTSSLSQLVKVYYAWLYSGGQRASLFMPGGAVVSDAPGSLTTPIDEWNFSTTEVFEKRISTIMDIPDLSEVSKNSDEGEATPRGMREAAITPPPLKEMTNVQKANFEARVQRGEGLTNLFDKAKPDYEYKTKTDFRPLVEERRVSDLPFRAMAEDRPSSIASNVIDLGDFDSDDYAIAAPMKEEPTIQLADAATIRAKRSDSKGPARDTSASRKNSTKEDDLSSTVQEISRTSAHDFAFPPKEWTTNDKNGTRDNEDVNATELTPVKDDGRKTMDWTFASAVTSSADEDDEPKPVNTKQSKANKHATLEWSFSNAMAEADTGSDDDMMLSNSRKTTPKRPVPLMRTMTQPVTSNEVHTAEDFPRPSTAMSEAYSESSMSSADVDPFALEGDQELPASITQAMDNMNVSSYYSNGPGPGGHEHAIPYSSTTAGPAPYILGPPARIGEPNFPGPQGGVPPSSVPQNRRGRRKQQDSDGSSNSSGRPQIELPEAVPPSAEALGLDAPAEVVENELGRLLGGLQASLAGASQALSMMKKPRRKETRTPRGRTRPSSSEWEDEE